MKNISLKGEINFPISSLQEEGFNEIIKTFNIDAQYK